MTVITHLEILKKDFARAAGDPSLTLQALTPDYDVLLAGMARIGDNWHLRPEHQSAAGRARMRALIEGPRGRMWQFIKDREAIGICSAVAGGVDLQDHFRLAARNAAEIYKIGFYPDHTGKGYGGTLVPMVLEDLFDEFDAVYLNTRDSNRINAVPFYQRLGLSIVGRDLA